MSAPTPPTIEQEARDEFFRPIRDASRNARLLEDKRALQSGVRELMRRFGYEDVDNEVQEYHPERHVPEGGDE